MTTNFNTLQELGQLMANATFKNCRTPPLILNGIHQDPFYTAVESIVTQIPVNWTSEYEVQPPTSVIHQTLRGTTRAYDEMLNHGELLGDGGFARVIALGNRVVMKATCCPATWRLLSNLYKSQTGIAGLPLVYQSLGAVGVDADQLVFQGYFVERLFKPQTCFQERQRQELTNYFALALQDDHDQSDTALSIQVTEECMRTDKFSLGEAFSMLLPVLNSIPAVLDLTSITNVMFTAKGKISLADPLASVI